MGTPAVQSCQSCLSLHCVQCVLLPSCSSCLVWQLLPNAFPPTTSTAATDRTQWLAHQGNSAALTRIPTSYVNTFQPIKILFLVQSLNVYLNFLDYKILSPKIASSSTSWKVKSLKYEWPGRQPLKVPNLNAHQMKEPFIKTQMRDHWPGTDTVTKRSQMPVKTKFYPHQFHHRYYCKLCRW